MTSNRTVDLSAIEWVKSSYSGGNGGQCVETARTPIPADWFKSSYSEGDGGECVETSRSLLPSHLVPVRDSKVATGPVLTVSVPAWAAFLSSL
ncbi:DUF397 domain-containing protein [Streptomyces sp. DSM 44917]|uniref:DUF397 domain-containing protein n=1 Tax=Streptomyces boetiae TaxID=3075541 RepID=A0ABU2LDR3_9ACTN|nr:DUF397 domain-containing protein [Streptomyces sp. DSM 44917]MDT0309715.1 DUF397 domain-containing protein [Streptomyces sp. DSM 44917]